MGRIKVFILVFIIWTVIGSISKVLFLMVYHSLYADVSFTELIAVLWYGLRLDLAIAGYLTLLPGLVLIITLWWQGSLLHGLWKGYSAVAAFLASLAYIANLGLYGYWGFPLDNTPLLYIKTSPADALASLTWWQLSLSVLAVIIV